MKPQLGKLLFAASLLTLSTAADATVWQIDAVLGGSGGFGASNFHDASVNSPMSGTNLGNISFNAAGGTYNDVTGEFTGTFNVSGLSGVSMFTLTNSTGPFIFNNGGGFGELLNASTLNITFDGTVAASNFAGSSNDLSGPTSIGFSKGFVCCGQNGDDPNSFHAAGPGMAIMTLWGADGHGAANANGAFPYNNDPRLGMDLRIKLTAIPLPLSLPLLGSGLFMLGLVGRRKKRARERLAA